MEGDSIYHVHDRDADEELDREVKLDVTTKQPILVSHELPLAVDEPNPKPLLSLYYCPAYTAIH